MLIGLTIAAILFWRGSAHRTDKESPVSRGRAVLFYSGLGAVFLALQTPLDVIAGHMFSVHQVQHLLLRGVAPMLLMLSLPSGPLIAGFPTAIRRRFVAPMMRNNGVQSIFGFVTRPLVCTTVYVTSLYFWQLPAYHNAALINTTLHYVMHISMLASGVLIFLEPFQRSFSAMGPAVQPSHRHAGGIHVLPKRADVLQPRMLLIVVIDGIKAVSLSCPGEPCSREVRSGLRRD